MIQVEHLENGNIRFATKRPMNVEVMNMDGKMFVHSEPLTIKNAQKTKDMKPNLKSNNDFKNNANDELDDIELLKDAK